ncbi:MAG: hypothetical protein INH41_25625 [Myxococcaceae bacterium]|nr:hypothetical protein [Myxococcaceae bacterium]MCA3015781.1 hypothetical protein [Myxococcaceae bacterium]
MPLSTLEKNILKTKGLTDAQLARLTKAGVTRKADFAVVGDAATLSKLGGLPPEVAAAVMAWATGAAASPGPGTIVVDSDAVTCVHCGAKQPKDYHSGDLCPACGKQAEPTFACFWCGHSGPGKYCRSCGAEFVATGELELALLLKRDGLPKDEIPRRLRGLSAKEKEALWGRVRKAR